ncbi:MAG: YfhO family protein [Candidatus Zixiibacteriota bacterium]
MKKNKKKTKSQKQSTKSQKSQTFFDRLPSWAIALGFLFIIWVVLFSKFIFSGDMLMGTDMMQNGYFDRNFLANSLKDGFFPLWEPYLHGGMPFIEAMHGVVFYPTTILNLILPVHYALGLSMILHVLLAGLFTFLFLKRIGIPRMVAFIGGLSYMLAPFFVSYIYGGHDGKMFVISLFPLAMYALEVALRRKKLHYYLLFGLVYFFMVISPHMQLAYFSSWLLGAYFVFHHIRQLVKKREKIGQALLQTGAFFLGVLLLLAVAAPQILPPTKYLGEYSQRKQHEESGYEYSTSWSLHPGEMASLLNHDFVGQSVKENTYWSKNPFKLNSDYAGLLPIIIGIFALIFSTRPRKWLFFGSAVFTGIFALGGNTPFFRIFYHLIPQVKKFRAPSMIIFLFGFSMIVLMAYGLEAIADKKLREKISKKKFNMYILIAAGIVLLGAIITSAGGISLIKFFNPSLSGTQMQAANRAVENFTQTAWLNLFLIYIALGIMWLWFNRKMKAGFAVAIFSLIIVLDLWRVNKDYIQVIEPEPLYSKKQVVDYLLEQKEKEGPFRVFIMPKTFGQIEDTYLANYGLEEVTFTALHGNQLIWYDKFVGRLQSQQGKQPNLFYPVFWDILNVRYLVTKSQLYEQWMSHLEAVGMIGNIAVYKNPNALPRATVFENYEITDDRQKIIDGLRMDALNPYKTVYLEEDPGIQLLDKPDSLLRTYPAEVKGLESFNEFTVEANAPDGGILFLSENYYPDWKCYSDGKELPIMRANYSFRAVPLEPGQHTLEFRYESPIIKKSFMLSLIAIILTIGLFVVSMIVSKKGDK